ncbi:MAG: cell division protein ZapA [Pseudomonadota bacterium]
MAEVNVQINRKQYTIACDAGQEQRVIDLAAHVDERIKELIHIGAGTNESHLLVLNSIMMADELVDARGASANTNTAPLDGLQITQEDEAAITDAIDQMAERINKIAGNLQSL